MVDVPWKGVKWDGPYIIGTSQGVSSACLLLDPGPVDSYNAHTDNVGRIIGLDVGERRIGVAISTPEGLLAVPLRIIVSQNEPAAIEEVAALARAEEASAIVVGYPLLLDGTAGLQARRIEGFARRLGKQSGIPIELWDERLSSVQAARSTTGKRARARVDDVAAAIILQAYLDRQQSNASP